MAGARGIGWTAWAVFAGVVLAYVLAQPAREWVDDVYRGASARWWSADAELYGAGPDGFLYVPPFAPLFTPFEALPRPIGLALWRLLGFVLLATGLRRALRLAGGADDLFGLATLLTLAATWAASRTGQSNVHLAGVLLHVAADLAAARRWRVAVLLGLALVLKPIALAPLLLVGVLWPPVGWRAGVVLAALALLSFLHPDPGYVGRMYAAFVQKASEAGTPGRRYNDLSGLLSTLGLPLGHVPGAALRALGGLATLGLSWLAVRRLGRSAAALPIAGWVACYWMLFNPRTETNSYVLLAPFVAGAAAAALLHERRRPTAVALALLALGLACDVFGTGVHRATTGWLKPLLALLFAAWWTVQALRAPSDAPPGSGPPDG